jgi:chaperonin GroEL
MANKHNIFSSNVIGESDCREMMGETLDHIAGIVGSTLGPYGRHAIVQDVNLQHFATKDGYSVLRKIFFKHPFPRTILDLLKRISFRLVRSVGDGSTSAVVASNEIYKTVTAAGSEFSPKDVVDGLSIISDALREEIVKRAIVLDDTSRLRDVAYISTNSDSSLADMIQEIFREVGLSSAITVESGDTSNTYYERTSGIQVDRGIINPYFATSATETGIKCEHDNAFVFMCDDALGGEDIGMVANIMQQICSMGQPLILVAKGYDSNFKEFLHINKVKNMQMPIAAIDIATGTPESFSKFEDLAIYLGCRHYSKFANEQITEFPLDRLGQCASVKGTDMITQFLGGRGSKDDIQAKLESINGELNELLKKEDHIEHDTNITILKGRAASLSNGMVVIKVGGSTPQEIETRKFLVEDAVFACQSAVRFGIVMGGNLVIPKILSETEFADKLADTVASQTFLSKAEGHRLITAVSDAFKEVFIKVLAFMDNDIIFEKLRTNHPELLVGIDTPMDAVRFTVNRCCSDWETIFNAKTLQFETFPNTEIINSAETDYEIVRSTFSIIGLLITSGQFVSSHLIEMAQMEKQ